MFRCAHFADVHFRGLTRHEEYTEVFSKSFKPPVTNGSGNQENIYVMQKKYWRKKVGLLKMVN